MLSWIGKQQMKGKNLKIKKKEEDYKGIKMLTNTE